MRPASHSLLVPLAALASVTALALLAAGCATRQPPVAATPATSSPTGTLVSAKSGRSYTVTNRGETDLAVEPFAPPTAAFGKPSPDNFHGTDRRDAKTSPVDDSQPQTFADIESLLASSLLVPDDQMLNHQPPITKAPDDPRTDEEQHAVEVTAYLYASAKESDNDFHCILGAAPDHAPAFLNAEVSGLPEGASRQSLMAVRDAFKSFFGDSLPGTGYSHFDPPIQVHIKGSIFYDIDHKPGTVGPEGQRPTTAWEIHPITSIDFEPGANP